MSEALSILSNVKINMDVFVIATMTSQSNQSYPQLQKVFPRWVVLSNHNEPISGLVGRYLRRQLLEFENRNGGIRNMHLAHIIDWIPKVWKHVNRLIEKYNSAEVTLGMFHTTPVIMIITFNVVSFFCFEKSKFDPRSGCIEWCLGPCFLPQVNLVPDFPQNGAAYYSW